MRVSALMASMGAVIRGNGLFRVGRAAWCSGDVVIRIVRVLNCLLIGVYSSVVCVASAAAATVLLHLGVGPLGKVDIEIGVENEEHPSEYNKNGPKCQKARRTALEYNNGLGAPKKDVFYLVSNFARVRKCNGIEDCRNKQING